MEDGASRGKRSPAAWARRDAVAGAPADAPALRSLAAWACREVELAVALAAALPTRRGDALAPLVAAALDHVAAYYEHKARLADRDVVAALDPRWLLLLPIGAAAARRGIHSAMRHAVLPGAVLPLLCVSACELLGAPRAAALPAAAALDLALARAVGSTGMPAGQFLDLAGATAPEALALRSRRRGGALPREPGLDARRGDETRRGAAK